MTEATASDPITSVNAGAIPSDVPVGSFLFTNLTTTFTGIGHVVVDINSLVHTCLDSYRLNIKQVPAQTVREYIAYVIANLTISSLQDLRLYSEPTGDVYFDLLLNILDGGSFLPYQRLTTSLEEDRIALVLTSQKRTDLNVFCHLHGLYIGLTETLVFEYPHAHAQILRPSEVLYPGITYKPTDVSTTGASTGTATLSALLAAANFTLDSLNDQFRVSDREFEYKDSPEEIDQSTAASILSHNTANPSTKLHFDGRIFLGLRRPVVSESPDTYDSPFDAPDKKWSGDDLDLILPPIPERPNLKHLANIRKSALSMYEEPFQYSMAPPSEDTPKQKKTSNKAQKMMQENLNRMAVEKKKDDNDWLGKFFSYYSKLGNIAARKTYLEGIKASNAYTNNKLNLLKIELYMEIWHIEEKNTTPDERVLVPLYLACLRYVDENCILKSDQCPVGHQAPDVSELQFVLSKLAEAGFEATVHELLSKYAIPDISTALPFKTKATAAPNDLDLYFQLRHAGDHLKRTLGTRKDKRVPFDPDKWQVDLLDAVDANKSAVVTAPTSSGKTFICFYAIEKVLRSSNTDVVIFCLPTKALANQVSADIYARFTPKNCRLSLQGTLMADRCTEPFNSQILITIPSMLESLLNSSQNDPRTKDKISKGSFNTSRVKYIIIDEVHKINDPTIGLSIERIIHMAACPLLLLSATIGNLHGFFSWFHSIEASKGRECTLVTHNERFCELKPHVWCNNKAVDLDERLTGAGDQHAATGRLVPLNCMFAYSFSHLRDFGFGNDVSFLPEELLNLYYYIFLTLLPEQRKIIKRLAPKNFFSSNIISKADIRKYERHLLSTFEEWVRQGILSEPQVRDVYNMLVGESLDAFPIVSTESYLVNNMIDLLNTLKKDNMLPVIIFNTDRELVTRLAKAVYMELESQDIRKKKDKALEKMRKETKRNRDNERTRDSWIEDSIAMEQAIDPDVRDIRFTFLDQQTKLSDTEIKEELYECRSTSKYALDMVYRGIGIHHAAMERKYRSAIEILFRKRHVRVLFATETLALGINMPCRTVVFAGDSLELNPMNYKQMAGRAGRRGYDTLGNVVFLGIPRNRVQNLMVSMLPKIQGAYTYSNTSLISFDIEDSLLSHPLLGSAHEEEHAWRDALRSETEAGGEAGQAPTAAAVNQSLNQSANPYIFSAMASESARKSLIIFQKSFYSFIYPSSYLWDLFISNRCEDPSIFILGYLIHSEKIFWEPAPFMLTIASLFEVRPCLPETGTVLGPVPPATASAIARINQLYLAAIGKFYSPQLKTLGRMAGKPLHYIRSFIYSLETPKNSYIYDFYQHGSAVRISQRNRVPEGELWQSLYNIDYMLNSLMKLLETHYGSADPRLKALRVTYEVLHSKFQSIFA